MGKYYYVSCLLLIIALTGCLMPDAIRHSEKTAQHLANNETIKPEVIPHPSGSLHYYSRRHPSAELTFVFIHGTPGNWRAFAPQLDDLALSEAANLVAIDRPGWGQSVFASSGELPLGFAEQVAGIAPLLRHLRQQAPAMKIVLVGHSLGASLAPSIAMHHPRLVDGVVALAGDLSVDYLQKRWYNHIASWFWVRYMLPKTLDHANQEVLALFTNLIHMAQGWTEMKVPMLVIQGEQDSLVDARNANFAEQLRTKSRVEVLRFAKEGHLLHLTKSEQVNRHILAFAAGL